MRRANQRRSYLQRTYGVPLGQLEQLLNQQAGRCAICRRRWRECKQWKPAHYEGHFLEHLCIDHDHKTGHVRGLLCWGCNFAIGALEENIDRFNRAAAYMERGTAALSLRCASIAFR